MKDTNGGIVIGIIIGMLFGLWLESDNKEIKRAIGQCEIVRDDYTASLERANEKIANLNNSIDDSQSYAWSTYNDMGYALENLEMQSEEDDPGTICYKD